MNERLKKIRKQFDLTQQQFADKLGLKRNTIATYESGRNEPIQAVISLICREFNINEEWLRNGTGEMFIELDEEDQLMEWTGRVLSGRDGSFKKRLLKILMSLSEDEWKFIEKKARELIEEE